MSVNIVADIAALIMTGAVREQLHIALDQICDDLRSSGELGVTVKFKLTPEGGEENKGDELAVTMQVLLCPLFDGEPCGYFVPVMDVGKKGVN